MKLALFCLLAVASAEDLFRDEQDTVTDNNGPVARADAENDGGDLSDVASIVTNKNKCSKASGTEFAHFTFSQGSNWNGDTGPAGNSDQRNQLNALTYSITDPHREDGKRNLALMYGPHESMLHLWRTQATYLMRHPRCNNGNFGKCSYQCTYRRYGRCYRYSPLCNGQYCYNSWARVRRCNTRSRNCMRWRGRYYYLRRYCRTQRYTCGTGIATSGTKAAVRVGGFCNIAKKNGEDMWVVAGSAVNNDGSLARYHASMTHRQELYNAFRLNDQHSRLDGLKTFMSIHGFMASDNEHYCEISTEQAWTLPAHECKISLDVETTGRLEGDDLTCVSAVTSVTGTSLTRACLTGNELARENKLETEWFKGDDTFQIALSAMTDGAYFNGLEIISHDNVKLTCRACTCPTCTMEESKTGEPIMRVMHKNHESQEANDAIRRAGGTPWKAADNHRCYHHKGSFIADKDQDGILDEDQGKGEPDLKEGKTVFGNKASDGGNKYCGKIIPDTAIHWEEQEATKNIKTWKGKHSNGWGPYLGLQRMTQPECIKACEKNDKCSGWSYRYGNRRHIHYNKCFLLDDRHTRHLEKADHGNAKGDFNSGVCKTRSPGEQAEFCTCECDDGTRTETF
jgi:hypothetical protein